MTPRRLLSLLLLSMPWACGSGSETPDAGGPGTNACGLVGEVEAEECAGLNECGAGASNFKPVVFCDHCPWRADSHTCEAGRCRPLAAHGTVAPAFSPPAEAAGARGLTITTFASTAADGTKLTCAALLSGACSLVQNPNLPAANSLQTRFGNSSGAADPSLTYNPPILDYVGEERLILVQITSEMQGAGRLVARGCVEGVSVREGQRTDVSVELRSLE